MEQVTVRKENGRKKTLDLTERLELESKGNIISLAVSNPYTGPGNKPGDRLLSVKNLKKLK